MTRNLRNLFSHRPRRTGMVALAALTPFFLCGASAPNSCGPSTGQVVGTIAGASAAIAVPIIVLVEVNKSHHNIKGCVTSGPNGLEVQVQKDKGFETYDLTGTTTNLREGDLVKVHGAKEKKRKDSPGDPVFRVEKISKDYGPCHVAPKTVADAIAPAE